MSEAIILLALFATVAFVIWVLATEMQRRSRLKSLMELRLRLLDRLNSAADIAAVLASEGGARFLSSLDEPSWAGFHGRVLRTIQTGIVLLFVSAGLLALAYLNSFGARQALSAFAVMAGCVGAGLLISSVVAWRLGVRSGLIKPSDGVRVESRSGDG